MRRILLVFALALLVLSQAGPTYDPGTTADVPVTATSAKLGGKVVKTPLPTNPPVSGGSGSSGEDFEVDVDSGVQGALDKIIGSGGSSQAKTQFTAAAAAKPSQAEFSAASAAAPAGAAKPAAMSAAGGAGKGVASSSMFYPGPGPIDPGFGYPYDPYYPWYRRRLHCHVTYWPTWKICCWFTWWWWYM